MAGKYDDDLITYTEAAELLGVPLGTLYGWVHDHYVPHVRFGPRLVRFSRATLAAWIAAHIIEARDAR